MRQPAWDVFEVAFLLDHCIKVEQGIISRADAIRNVSQSLRARAISSGIEIDDTFRNENGISMQMAAIRNHYLGKPHGLTVSKLFIEIVTLYKEDASAFKKILQGEQPAMEKSVWQKFLQWLNTNYPQQEKNILASIDMLNMLGQKSKLLQKPIQDITEISDIELLMSKIMRPHIVGFHSTKHAQSAYNALELYLAFLKASTVDNFTNSSNVTPCHDYMVDFSTTENYAHTKPASCKYKGNDVLCSSWNELFINLVKVIYQECKDVFPIGKSLSASKRIDIGPSDQMIFPKEISGGIYLECNVSSTGVINKLRTLMNMCGIDYSHVSIIYRKNKSAPKIEPSQTHTIESEQKQSAWAPQYTDQINFIIFSKYKYGFRIGSPIELMRLRNYADEEGIPLPSDDDELKREIQAAGVLIDGKVFALREELLQSVRKLLLSTFDLGARLVFYVPFFEKNGEWMIEHNITSVATMKEILKRSCPDYYFGQNIVTTIGKISEHDAIVEEVLRVCSDKRVVLFTDLETQLPYIPADKIAWSLSVSPEFVWISEGKYFLMKYFIANCDDITTLISFVAAECNAKGYASMTDIPLGSIPEDNYELSTAALHTAIYNFVLKSQYYLNGKILTREENGLDISKLLRAYCAGRRECSASEVMDRAIELTGSPNKQYAMEVLYDTMVRIDRDRFVSEEMLSFDISQIDDVLASIVGERFAPIKAATTFALFPACGFSWNHYLLESYCYRFSKKYRLSVLNFNDKNAGLIVAVNLPLSYQEMLCEAAANADIELTPESTGNYFFESGMTAKRKYSNLPDIIERAMTIREER